jgi:predicted double-glycine peptidase
MPAMMIFAWLSALAINSTAATGRKEWELRTSRMQKKKSSRKGYRSLATKMGFNAKGRQLSTTAAAASANGAP